MKKFVCTVCGYIHEGETAPEVCPVCKVGADKFEEMSGERVWADEHRIGVAAGVDEEILEGLRQPLEDKDITIVRMGRTYTYPADFMLVGAMNPCKCGYYPDRSRCNCSEQDIKRYIGKISMPLWDRFDMCIKTDEIGYEQIRCSSDNGNVPDSESMKQAVMRARLAQLKRFNGMNIKYNSQMSTGDMKRFCRLGEEEEKLIKRIFAKKRLTARGYSKILKTARTIADIDGNVNITTANISEAFYYRGIPEVTIH